MTFRDNHTKPDEGFEGIEQKILSEWPKYLLRAVLALGLIFAVLNSWYTVDKDEEATVRRFGAHIATTGPGLHFMIPFVDKVQNTSVTTVHRIEIGFRTTSVEDNTPQYAASSEEAEMLTADDNIANIDFVVQYRSSDAAKWQFSVMDPEKTLNLMAQAAMRLIIGRSDFDRAATIGKAEIQDEVRDVLQAYSDSVETGAQIVSVQLQDVQPPAPVIEAFKDVVTAREERETLVQVANRHANRVLPQARGEAAQITNSANAYSSERVAEAMGDVARFNEVLVKYQASPEVTAQRLIFETQEKVLRGQTIVVDPSEGGLLKFFNIDGSGIPTATQK